MSAKERTSDNAVFARQLPLSVTQSIEAPLQQATHSAILLQRTQLIPFLLTQGNVLQLQRTLGNQAVRQLLVGSGNSIREANDRLSRQEKEYHLDLSNRITGDTPYYLVNRAPIRAKPKSTETRPGSLRNDVWDGSESGPLALPGHKFISDPFDHTVTVIRPDGTGTQFTYSVEDTQDPDARLHLTHTEELSSLRVKALAFLDQNQGTFQESEAESTARQEKDRTVGEEKTKEWAASSPDNKNALDAYNNALRQYSQDIKAYRELVTKEKGAKPPIPPAPPKGMPANPRTTLCNGFPPKMAMAIAGSTGSLANFDPSIEGQKRGSWRTLEMQPEGPRPGDVYSLGAANDKREIKHLGVFKSSRSGPNGIQIWTVVDGGQGAYESKQQILERTRYYNPKTQLLSSELADSGQLKGDRSLRGWIDIDAHFKKTDAAQ